VNRYAPIPVVVCGGMTYHTSLHCAWRPDGPGRYRPTIVTSQEKARADGKRRCTSTECAGTPYYWWREGAALTEKGV